MISSSQTVLAHPTHSGGSLFGASRTDLEMNQNEGQRSVT
jgi:hypothetical protein